MKQIIIITSIIFLLLASFGLRIWRIDKAPASVNWDEAALGYNAYSMLLTGKDEFAKAMPVSLRSFDDYKPALYAYLAVPFIRFIGLNALSTRIGSVISGVMLVFFVVYITSFLLGKLKYGLLAGVFTTVSPWALHFSRIAFEANLAASLYFAGLALFVMALRHKYAYIGAIMMMVLSMYAYHAQRAIAIPTLIILTMLFWNNFKDTFISKWKIYLAVAVIGLLPLIYSFLTEPAGSRLVSTFILKLWPFAPHDYPLLIYNPIYSLIMQLAGQFLAYFSPVNIFLKGSTEPILRIPTLGLLPLELFPLWIFGLFRLNKNRSLAKVLGTVLVMAPLPAVITWNWFSVVRTLALYPAFIILAAAGGKWLWERQFHHSGLKFAVGGFWAVLFSLSSLYTFLTITIYAPLVTFGDFQPGFKETVPYVMQESAKYSKVVIDSDQAAPYIFFLFYSKYPPALYLKDNHVIKTNNGTEKRSFGKFEVRNITRADLDQTGILYMGPVKSLPDWAVTNIFQKEGARVKDFKDLLGYTSYRVVSL